MPVSNYTGVSNGVAKAPSPAPAPRAIPVLSIPGGDTVRTIESILQQMQTKADHLAHIAGSVGLDVPVQPQFGTGFTLPVNNALGGTIQPLGTAHTTDGTRFMIQIQTGGAVGTATFKTSMDGGNTYGALQTTAASMTDATSGITLTFSGTFTALGTSTFHGAFTPLASWADSAGNRRSFIDHLGNRRGRFNEVYIDFLELGSSLISGANSNTAVPSRLYWSIPAAAQIGPGGINNTHQGLSLNGSNVANATTSRLYTPVGVASVGSFGSVVMEFEVFMSATATDFKVGLNRSPSSAVATPSTAVDEFALCAQAGDANWQLLVNAAGSAGVTKIDTGVPKSTTVRVTLEWHGSASAYGASTALLFLNDVLVANGQGSNVPAWSGVGLPSFIVAATTTNATNSLGAFVGPVRIISPRYASIAGI